MVTRTIDTSELSPEAAKLVARKQQIYSEVSNLREENDKLNEQLVRVADINKLRLPQLLCW